MTWKQVHGNDLVPDLSEARRLLDCGLKLVQLHPYQKRPLLDGWNRPEQFASMIIDGATGYGVSLAANKLCSVDPDNAELARIGLAALGFSLERWMAAGVRTRSTRPESGGRSMFLADGEIGWVKFSAGAGTILELRADSPNLQDVVPGLVYRDKDGILRTQSYANGRRYDDAPVLPDDLQEFWERCSTDIEYLHQAQRAFASAVAKHTGDVPSWHLAVSVPKGSGKRLGFSSQHRGRFNARNTVESVLARHGYKHHAHLSRWSRPGATGEPGIRPIPGKDGLWQSDHAGDPLFGTFDAWSAFVVLEHSGDLVAAERAAGLNKPDGDDPFGFLAKLKVTAEMIQNIQDTKMIWRNVLAHGHLCVWAGQGNSGKSAVARFTAAELAHDGYAVHYFQEDAGNSDLKRLQGHAEAHGYSLLNSTLGRSSIEEILAGFLAVTRSDHDLSTHVFILDTLKKFVDALSKREARDFFSLMRSITVKGGTVLLLGHTNKHVGQDGKPIFEGVGDVRNDVDELFYVVGVRDDSAGETVITLTPDKVRCLAEPITLVYDFAADTTRVNSEVMDAEYMRDRPMIELAVVVLVERGSIRKTVFVEALTADGMSKRDAERIITTYSRGPHKRWSAAAGATYNAKIYTLDALHDATRAKR